MSEIEGQFNENKENSPQRSETNQAELQVVNKNQDQENEKKENIPDNAQVEQNIQQEESPLIQNKIDRNNGTQNNFNQNQQQRSQADFRKSIYFQSSQRETNSAQSYFSRFQQRENLRKGCSEICCLPIGSHTFCCSSENTEKDFIQFGVGINLYFRFLKKIGCYFLIFTILSIPQLFFSVLSYVGSKARDSTNYYQFLMATTIGATSLNNQDCQIQYFDNLDVVVEFSLKCDSGNLAGSSFIYGIVNSNEQACIYLSQSELNLNTTNQDRLNQIRQDIDSQEEYSFNLLQSDFDKEDPKGKRIYAGARCKEAYITIGELEMQQKIVPVIFASCDAAIVILFIFFLLSLTSSEKKYNKISQKETPTLQHFSIQISSLPQSEQLIKALQVKENEQSKQILLLEVKKFIEYQLKSVLKQQDLQIYDIQVSEKQKILQLQQELKSQKEKIYEYLKEMENINFQQYQQAQTHFMDQAMSKDKYQRFYENLHQLCQDSNSEQKQKLNAINQNIQNCWMKMDEISGNIEQIQQVGDCKYIWVTFDTMRQKQQVQEKLQSLPKDWFYYYCCFCCFDESEKKDKFLLQKFKLQVKDAPIPENINWNNLNYSQKQRFLRQCVSLIATLILLAGSWVLISYVNLEKSDFQQKYPSINCNNKIYENITVEQVQLEIDGLSTIKGYVECYCKPKLTDIFQGDYDICSDWSKQYAFQQSLPWIIVGGLIGVNVLIQYVFIFLSSWEKHLMISEEYSSRILKIFLGQFLNTGLILLITNIDFGNSTRNDAPETIRFLFGGKYGDIDSKWCQNIGVVLLLTLLVNILTQPLTLSCEMLFRFMRKVYDQNSCCLNEKKTKAKNYQEFKDLYKGEQFRVELRYAQTLTALYICFMYSPALPFLFCIIIR